MLIRLRKRLWEWRYSPEGQTRKKIDYLVKQLAKLIRGATGGGYVPPTLWDKVKIAFWLILITIGTTFLYFALIFASFQR